MSHPKKTELKIAEEDESGVVTVTTPKKKTELKKRVQESIKEEPVRPKLGNKGATVAPLKTAQKIAEKKYYR